MIEDGGRTKGRFGHRGTAFYIEALLLAGVLAMVVVMLARVFVQAGQLGKEAALLTDAVHLAENGAEAVAAAESLEEVKGLLEENGNAEILTGSSSGEAGDAFESAPGEDGTGMLRLYYDDELNPVSEGSVWMDIQWMPEASGELQEGVLVRSVITVNLAGRAEPVYTLETEVFIGRPGRF